MYSPFLKHFKNLKMLFFSSCWLFFWWGSIYQTGPTHSELHNPHETHWWKLSSRFTQLVSVFTAAAVPFLFFSWYSIKSVQFVTFWWLAVFQFGNQQKLVTCIYKTYLRSLSCLKKNLYFLYSVRFRKAGNIMEWHFTDTLFADKSGGINPFRQFSVIAK